MRDKNALVLLALVSAAWLAIGLTFKDELRALVLGAVQLQGRGQQAGERLGRVAPPVKPVSVEVHSEPELENRARRLLYEARYAELEQLLEQLHQDAARDPANEFRLSQAYFAFEDTESRMREELDVWIQLRPDSSEAIIARAGHRVEAAWARRGGGYSAEVAKDAMADFARLLDLATRDAEAALVKAPDHPVAWRNLIRAACGSTGASALVPLVRRLGEHAPASYTAHKVVMNFLQPRWGGSYTAMEQYAERAQAGRARNPRLEILRGFPYWAAGVDAASAEDYVKAVELFDRALSYGADGDFLEDRSRALKKLLRFKEAMADMKARHESFPTRRSKGALDDAQKDMRDIAYDLHRAKEDVQAIKAYEAFLEVWPDDEDVLFYQAQVSSRLNHYGEAMRIYRRVIELNPTRFEAVKGADQVLAREKRWNEILPLWDAYLSLVPDNGEAWFEQGGTYYQMGDIRRAYANTVKACELKHDAACAWRQRLAGHPALK